MNLQKQLSKANKRFADEHRKSNSFLPRPFGHFRQVPGTKLFKVVRISENPYIEWAAAFAVERAFERYNSRLAHLEHIQSLGRVTRKSDLPRQIVFVNPYSSEEHVKRVVNKMLGKLQ